MRDSRFHPNSISVGHWGEFYPSALAMGSSQGDKEAVQDKFLARIFLIGSDKRRFGMLVEDLNNSYIAGKDNYPKSLEATLKLLSNCPTTRSKVDLTEVAATKMALGTSFAQKSHKNLSKVVFQTCVAN
jgi:hypothetical protein